MGHDETCDERMALGAQLGLNQASNRCISYDREKYEARELRRWAVELVTAATADQQAPLLDILKGAYAITLWVEHGMDPSLGGEKANG